MAEHLVGDIVGRLRIDTAQWQQGLQQATQQLNQFQQGLTGRLSPALTTINQQFTTINNTTTVFATQMQAATRATSGLSQVLQIAAGIGLATSIQGMVGAMASFGTETIRTGARLEQLRASLGAIAGSVAAGQQQFDSLFQSAQRLGVPFESLARGWRTLTAAASQAGLPLSDQRRLLEAVAAEGRRVGASNEELSRAFLALGQMASKGTVSMEELRQQLGEALPTALAAMAQGMGRTTEELIKLVEAGGVRFPTAARALTRGLEDLQRQGTQTGDTLQTAFNRFANEVVRARDELARMAGPLKTATDVATNFLKVINDSVQARRQLEEARAGEARIGTGLREGDISRLPAEQQRRLTQINRLMAEQVLAQGDPNAPPMFQPSREEYLAQLKAERDAIFASAQAIKGKNDEQIKATGEINKAREAERLQADTLADVTKQMDGLTKAQAEFRAKAALAPETFGRPGTAEFLRGQEQALKPGVEKLAQTLATLPQGVMLSPELAARAREFDVQVGRIGTSIDALKEKQAAASKAEREAEAERKRLAREAEQDQENYQNAIDKTRMALAGQQDTAVATLGRLIDAYTRTGEAQDRVTAARLAAQFPENEQIQALAETVTALSEEAEANKESFIAIKQRTDALREASETQEAFQVKLDAAEARLRAPREERDEVKLRAVARAQGLTLTPEQETQLQGLTRLRREQEQLRVATELWRDLSQGIGSAWVQALSSIADGTKTVAEAFRAMGQSIMKTMADIAAQQAFQAVFKLGLGLLTGALTGGVTPAQAGTAAQNAAAGTTSFPAGAFFGGLEGYQHGGVIRAPTMAMLGEGPSSSMPEYVLNRQQMDAVMARSGSGPGSQVSIHNYPSRAAADAGAAQDRAQGRQAIVNAVLSDISQGSGSQIARSLRFMQQ